MTPWEVLTDPHRAFNLTAMRAADYVRRQRREQTLARIIDDDLGIARVIVLLSLIHEEG